MSTISRAAILAAAATICVCIPAFAAPNLDPTFGAGGMVVGPPNPPGTTSYAEEGVTADRREGVLFVRASDDGTTTSIYLTRLKADGSVDTAFAAGGSFPLGVSPSSIPGFAPVYTAIALDRRKILTAYGVATSITVRRFQEDGDVDPHFGTAGAVTLPVANTYQIVDVKAQEDRKVLVVTSSLEPGGVAGTSKITLYRLTEAGALDASFGTGGVVYTAVPGGTGVDRGTGLGLQDDGKILVAGRSRRTPPDFDAVVVRYNTNGTPDTSFGTAGIATVPFGEDRADGRRLALQRDGKVVVAGTFTSLAAGTTASFLFRLNGDGSLDPGFGASGSIVVPMGELGGAAYQIGLQPDGRPVVAATRTHSLDGNTVGSVLRLTAFGTRDTTWDGDGIYELLAPGYPHSNLGSIAIDDRDRILVSGAVSNGVDSRWFVARLKPGPQMECR